METNHTKLIAYINRKHWWHVPPADPLAYEKRGTFFASSYREAEFYGRPLDIPERLELHNPLIGDEPYVELTLLGYRESDRLALLDGRGAIEARLSLDAKLKVAAINSGYDSIVLLTPQAFIAYRESYRIPRSMELNVLVPMDQARRSESADRRGGSL